MNERGDLVFVNDPLRPTGNPTGHRGLCIVDAGGETEVSVRSLTQIHVVFKVDRSAVRTVYAASFVAEELFR